MEYIIINDSKLKIICEAGDLAQFGLNANSLEYSDARSRKFIENILDDVKIKLGFETASHRILIQLFPDRYGGCEIFISRLEAISQDSSEGAILPLSKASRKFCEHETVQKIYFFERLDFLLEACKRLSFLSEHQKSSAFYVSEGGYYLCLEIATDNSFDECGINSLNEYSFLLEYGEPQSAKEKLPYLMEYAKSICDEGAVETLSKI